MWSYDRLILDPHSISLDYDSTMNNKRNANEFMVGVMLPPGRGFTTTHLLKPAVPPWAAFAGTDDSLV